MRPNIRVIGLRRLAGALRDIGRGLPGAADRGLLAAARLVRDAAKKEFGTRSQTARPNPPPGPLIPRTGELRASIRAELRRDVHEAITGVPENIVYGAVHEFGMTIRTASQPYMIFTPIGQKRPIFATVVEVPPRPFLWPAYEKNKERVRELIGNAVVTLLARVHARRTSA
jgi:phage gpG-like protein